MPDPAPEFERVRDAFLALERDDQIKLARWIDTYVTKWGPEHSAAPAQRHEEPSSKSSERRSGTREHISFNIQYALDGESYETGFATDFSHSGMSMLTKEPIGKNTFVVRLVLPGHEISYEVQRVWERETDRDGETWYRSGLQFGRVL